MRKYLFPLLLCSAIGAVVVVVVLANRERGHDQQAEEPKNEKVTPKDGPTSLIRPPVKTSTGIGENKHLRELERLLLRKELDPKAHYYRQKVCEEMDLILESEKLTKNLLDAIRKHGIETDDEKRRELMLPILRVLAHPEATKMIEAEYFRAKNEEERLMLLEAMAHDYHNPETASVWAIEQALNAETEKQRYRAFIVIPDFSKNNPIIFKTARAIYEGTTRSQQSHLMIENIVRIAAAVDEAQDWIRKQLKNPRPDEITALVAHIDAWGSNEDAAYLESLAVAYPAMGDFLKQRAEEVRLTRTRAEGDPESIAKAVHDKVEREKLREAERLKAEKEKKEKEPGEDG